MTKSKRLNQIHRFWLLILIFGILLIVALRPFIDKSHPIPNSASPFPSPSSSLIIDDDDRQLDQIVHDKNLRWIYVDQDKKCILASYIYENSENDFLEGFWRKLSGVYRFEPINPGEGSIWFIDEVLSVKWDTSKLCRVGIEMNMRQNNDRSKHVWYTLDFQDGYVQGFDPSSKKPDNWDSMIEGEKLK